MNRNFFNRLLGISGGLGVIAGLLLVVVELQQNRAMMRAQIRNELAQGIIDVMAITANDEELAAIIVRANAGAPLTPAEALQVELRAEATFRYWENAHYQYRMGLYDESEFSKHLQTMRHAIVDVDRNLITHWCQGKQLFSDAFRTELDAVLPADLCAAPPLGLSVIQ